MGETPAETPASSEVDLLKQKMSKFGVLGAGVVLDSGAALAAAKVRFFFSISFFCSTSISNFRSFPNIKYQCEISDVQNSTGR